MKRSSRETLRASRLVDDLKQPAPKPRGIKLELIADPHKRARAMIIGSEPKAEKDADIRVIQNCSDTHRSDD